MKNVPAIRTSDSSAVLGCLSIFSDWSVPFIMEVIFSVVKFPSVLLSMEQGFNGCSLKI